MTRSRSRGATRAGLLQTLVLLGCSLVDPLGQAESGSNGNSGSLSCDLDNRYLSLTAAPKDGIPALSDPVWVAADHPTHVWFLRDSHRVVGFVVGGEPYAVPLNVLRYHEIVNATFETDGGLLDLAVTHCPLTGSSMVFDRAAAGGAEFGVSGILYQSNLVMYDRNTSESLWPQMVAGARCGAARGTALPLFPSIEMTWRGWVTLYPGTRVLGGPPEGPGAGSR